MMMMMMMTEHVVVKSSQLDEVCLFLCSCWRSNEWWSGNSKTAYSQKKLAQVGSLSQRLRLSLSLGNMWWKLCFTATRITMTSGPFWVKPCKTVGSSCWSSCVSRCSPNNEDSTSLGFPPHFRDPYANTVDVLEGKCCFSLTRYDDEDARMTVYGTMRVCVAVIGREKEECDARCVSCFSSSSL